MSQMGEEAIDDGNKDMHPIEGSEWILEKISIGTSSNGTQGNETNSINARLEVP
jgi:hypothetical protein